MTKRRCETIILNQATLTEIIQPIFPGQSVIDFQLMTEGLINTNYKIHVSNYDHPLLMRIYACDPDACQRETEIMSLIRGTVPVPEVIYSCTSNALIGRPYAILQWCEGVLLHKILTEESKSNANSAVYCAGEALAAIGAYAFDQSGFFGNGLTIKHPFDDDATSFMRGCLQDSAVRERLGTALYERVSTFIKENATCLKQTSPEGRLVHGDFNSKNILVKQTKGQWHISAILDWEWAHAGTPLFDLGSMLRYQNKHLGMQSNFISGFYNAGGSLPPNWKQISTFIDLNNLLEFLTGAEERLWLFDEAKQLIESTMNDWNVLVLPA